MIERLSAALEGRYRIERELGAGGMATVFLAEDLRHDRKVALKVLKPELAAVVGGERFLSEIKTTANLQHPHILPLYDSGEADSFLFYVMPYVEGESLRDKLDREKQLRVEEAVALSRKVADALDYAHEKGVVHRDIKPANILLSERGEPLVADFGIALAVSQAGGGRITETGLSLGTPHYMSPEQATGDRNVGPRSDVYALGCVLYEMLAGEPPFAAPTSQAVLARILTQEPRRVTELRRTVPSHVDAAIAKSLEKLPADRFESAEAFAAALDEPSFDYRPVRRPANAGLDPGAVSERGVTGVSARGAMFTAAAIVGLIIAFLAGSSMASNPPPPPTPSEAAGVLPTHRYLLADTGEFQPDLYGGVAVASDGTVAFVRGSGAARKIMVRSPRELRARAIEGTTGGFEPAFSPGGDWIVFSTETELRKAPTRGGPIIPLARTEKPLFFAPHWGPDGVIAVSKEDGLYRVPEEGGTPVRVYESPHPWGAVSAFILPAGRGWLFGQTAAVGGSDILLLDPETGQTSLVAESGTSPIWVSTGHVAFVHSSGALFAAPFDLERGVFASPPAPVLDSVRYSKDFRTVAASPGGAAAYITGPSGLAGSEDAEIVFLGVSGGETRRPPLEPTDHSDGRFSPDGERLAYTRGDQIWIYDLELGSHTRLTTEGRDHHDPVWSPDGTQIAFGSERGSSGVDVWAKDVEGDTPARPLLEMEGRQYPREWKDGGLLVIQTDHAGSSDIYTMPAEGSGSMRPYLRADWYESLARLSPDGRWLAYMSDERNNRAIFVRSFPQPGRSFLVSDPDVESWEPLWSPDGSVLYYRQVASGDVIAADVRTEPDFEVVDRRTVGTVDQAIRDVHPSGQWLLTFQSKTGAEEQAHTPRLIITVNWFSELLERLGDMR